MSSYIYLQSYRPPVLFISHAIVTSCVTISSAIVTLIIILVKTAPLETHTFQAIFSFRPGYFEQLPPKLSKETKRIYLFLGKWILSACISPINCKTTICLSPAISPFKSSFRFSAASSLVSVSLVCCWYFSASVLAAVRFSLSDEIWMLSLASVCSLLFLSSSSSWVSFA